MPSSATRSSSRGSAGTISQHGARGALFYIWNKLPLNGELPDRTLVNHIGSASFEQNGVSGIALDTKHFYAADFQANTIYVWDRVPASDQADPAFKITSFQSPEQLSSDGTYLAVAGTSLVYPSGQEGLVGIFSVAELSASARPRLIAPNQCGNKARNVLVYGGRFFMSDTVCNRIYAWNDIGGAIAGKAPDLVLGCPADDLACQENSYRRIGRSTLFLPGPLAFDGSTLWVGEVKFSGRLVSFSAHQ